MVALPVVGIAVGVTQVARGIVNTPEALAARATGKHWDQVGALATQQIVYISVTCCAGHRA